MMITSNMGSLFVLLLPLTSCSTHTVYLLILPFSFTALKIPQIKSVEYSRRLTYKFMPIKLDEALKMKVVCNVTSVANAVDPVTRWNHGSPA